MIKRATISQLSAEMRRVRAGEMEGSRGRRARAHKTVESRAGLGLALQQGAPPQYSFPLTMSDPSPPLPKVVPSLGAPHAPAHAHFWAPDLPTGALGRTTLSGALLQSALTWEMTGVGAQSSWPHPFRRGRLGETPKGKGGSHTRPHQTFQLQPPSSPRMEGTSSHA